MDGSDWWSDGLMFLIDCPILIIGQHIKSINYRLWGIMNTFRMALCEGRHETPSELIADGAVFNYSLTPDQIVNPNLLKDLAGDRLIELGITRGDRLNLVVTGLTIALTSTMNACRDLGVDLILLHYNRDTNDYIKQKIDWFESEVLC